MLLGAAAHPEDLPDDLRGENADFDSYPDRVLQDLKSAVQIGRLMETNIGKLIVRGRDCGHTD